MRAFGDFEMRHWNVFVDVKLMLGKLFWIDLMFRKVGGSSPRQGYILVTAFSQLLKFHGYVIDAAFRSSDHEP